MNSSKRVKQEKLGTSSKGEGEATQKSLGKIKKAKTAKQQNVSGEKESFDKASLDSDKQAVIEMPGKRRPKKAQSKKKKRQKIKTVFTDANFSVGKEREGVEEKAVKQEDGMPKQRRKYVRKQPVQKVKESPCDDNSKELLTQPEEENKPGGRHRRGAAKA